MVTQTTPLQRGDSTGPDKLAGACAILVGLSYLVVAVCLFLDPLHMASSDADFLTALAAAPTLTRIRYAAYGFGAIFAFGAIPSIAGLVRPSAEGWLRWTSNLAYLSFAATALDNARQVALLPRLAAAYAAGDPASRAILLLEKPLLALDPWTLLRFGALGAWILTISVLGRRRRELPGGLTYVGIAAALTLAMTVLGMSREIQPLIKLGAGLGGVVLLPIWFIWTGATLWARKQTRP